MHLTRFGEARFEVFGNRVLELSLVEIFTFFGAEKKCFLRSPTNTPPLFASNARQPRATVA
jgi:hypothetical protein